MKLLSLTTNEDKPGWQLQDKQPREAPEPDYERGLVVTILGHGGELLDVRYRHRAVISSLVVSWIQKLSKSTRTIVDAAMMEASPSIRLDVVTI